MPAHLASSTPGPVPRQGTGSRVSVLLPLPLAEAYDYAVPTGMALDAGDFVEVPLGTRQVIGVVWDDKPDRSVPDDRLRAVGRRFDAPPMRPEMRRLVEWVAAYTLSAPGSVLRMAMNTPSALEPPRPVRGYRPSGVSVEEAGLRMTPARRRVLEVSTDGFARTAPEIAREAGVGTGVVHGLAAAGVLRETAIPRHEPAPLPEQAHVAPILSEDQRCAADSLTDKVRRREFSVTLLDGVTGAGKTEVYFEAIAEALRDGRQSLVLVPEIALTAQWLDRFTARFGAPPVEWHSDLTSAQRRVNWRAVAEGRAQVVVGARSALFLPFADLGVIVVDEEHDPAFKQEDGVIYHARDMAVVRARIESIPIVLVSATPSLETLVNVEAGRYSALHLPVRHAGARMPEVHLVDMRRNSPPRGRWLSAPLHTAIGNALAEGEQAMLFLNRRGYAPLTLCRACGHRFQCPNCTAWLVEHRFHERLQCHHCGFSIPTPATCPSCGAEESLVPCGPGVERIAEELAAAFPGARTAVMASDTISGPKAAAEVVRQVRDREIDILVGTQVVAKGHHFPSLTVVGVVDGDLGLAGGDLRAAERTWQLLSQVAGRAGREDRAGHVFIQTFQPDDPVMQALASGDRERFLEHEMAARRDSGMPPFGRLAAVILSGAEERAVATAAQALARSAPHAADVRVLGPAPAPLSLLRGQYRYRLLLKAARSVKVQTVLRDWLSSAQPMKGVRLQIDVDPYNFL